MWAIKFDGEIYSTHDSFEEAWAFRQRHQLDRYGKVEHVYLG